MPRIGSHVVAAVLLIAAGQADAQFVKITDIPLPTSDHHGIAFDGANWHIAAVTNPATYHTYDSGFNFITDITIAGRSGVRGLTFDPNSGSLFLGDAGNSTIYEVTTAGGAIQNFTAGSGNLNALAYDPLTDTVWLARFSGDVEQYGRTGGLLSSFATGFEWTGLALDICTGNLFLLDTGDLAYEYQTDGTQVGQILGSDLINGNGQGLYYDPATAELYATSQVGDIALFQDSSRATCSVSRTIPTLAPFGLLLLGLMMAGIGLVAVRFRRG